MNITIYKNYKEIDFFNQSPEQGDETDEIVRSFILSLLVQKGSFVLDKTIGCDFHSNLRQLSTKNFKSSVTSLLTKYASNFPLINIENVESSIGKLPAHIQLSVLLSIRENIYFVVMEVSI